MYIIEKSLTLAQNLLPKIYDTSLNRNWHFAFTYRKNKLLTIGYNDMSTESARVLKFAKRFNTKPKYLFTHAEIDAISRLWGHTYINHRIKFVIIRLNRFLELGDSKPCDDCQQILDALGITEVYWSNSDKSFRNKYEKVYEVH